MKPDTRSHPAFPLSGTIPSINRPRIFGTSQLIRTLPVVLVLLASMAISHAASGTWNGTANALWTNDVNWSASPAPGTGDTATFNGGGNGNTTIDLTGGVTDGAILFDTANAAPYTIGTGAAGSQTLTLDVNGGITMSSTVINNQVLNANLALPTLGFYNIINNSAANTLTLAGTNSSTSTGSTVLTVDGTGATAITGPIVAGTGSMGLQKTNSGTLTLSGGGFFSATNVNCYLPGAAYVPVDLRAGTTIISSGVYSNAGEFVVGGVITNGGTGDNVNLTLNGGSLGVSTWFSLGRGNGIGGVSSDVVLNNSASIVAGNVSCGYNAGTNANLPKGSLKLNNTSSFTVTGNGSFFLGESAGSDMTMTLSNSARLIGSGTGAKRIGAGGNGTLNINDTSSVSFGNGQAYVGYRTGNGVLNMTGGTFTNIGNLRVGGSDINGTAYNATGTVTIANATMSVGSLTVARGNNNQNTVSGLVTINSGGTINSEGDVLLGFAGNANLGKLVLNGGTLNVATTTKRWVIISQWDTSLAEMNINSGLMRINANTDIRFSTGNNTGSNVFNLNGGAVTFYSDNATTVGGSGVIDMKQGTGAATINTFNLNGGTLTVPGILSAQTTGTRIFNFNGGTLRPTASSTTFFNLGTGTAVANVRDGGAVIDCNGYNITIAQALVHSTISGDAAIDGGLTKLGSGTLTLSAIPSYTGPTKVLGGASSMSTASGSLGSSSADLVVSNATLTLDASSGYAMSANNVNVGSTLNLTVNPSANAINGAGNLTLNNNTTINLGYGTVSGNPSAAAINASGSLTKGTNIVINVSAVGLSQGVIPLITVGSGTVDTNGFVLGTLPAGVRAVLTNSTSARLDLYVTFAGQFLNWRGGNSDCSVLLTNWDISTSTNWYDISSNLKMYLQYNENTIGDNVVFGDNGCSIDGTNYVNLPTNVVPATVAFSSASPYRIEGSGGIGGATSLVVTNMNNSVYLGTSNSYTGGTAVGGGTLIITSDNALGATSGGVTLGGGTLQLDGAVTNSRSVALIGSSTIGVGSGVAARLNGTISGSGALTKNGNGTLTLAGNSTYTGPTVVSAGALNLTGTVTNSSYATVGGVAGNSTLDLSTDFTANHLYVGNVSGAAAAVRQTGGTVSLFNSVGDKLNLGQFGSYGYYDARGGTLNVDGIAIGGSIFPTEWPPTGTGDGILEVNGATVNNTGWITLARGGSANIAILNVYSGSLTYGGGGIGCNWELSGSDQTSIINIMGGSVTSTNQGVNFRTPNTGILNLNGGLLSGTSVTGYGMLNFNGGTLRPATNFVTPFLNLSSNVYIYSGGATIDDSGLTVTISQPLLAPTGNGVSNVFTIGYPGAGYIAPPIVTISGDGAGATAIAQINRAAGTVTNIVLTCPGVGYTATPSVNLTGGGATSQATVTSSGIGANVGGGLIKAGSGTLTLSGANTYTGSTIVTNGTLIMTTAYQGGGAVAVADNARLTIFAPSVSTSAMIGDLTMGNSGATSLSFAYSFEGNPTNAAVSAGAVRANGTSTISIGGSFTVGTFPLIRYTSYLSPFSGIITPRGVSATLSNSPGASTIYVIISGMTSGIAWTGTNSTSPNLWDLNTTTNWLSGVDPTTYQETVPPGDAVNFTDGGSGTVLLSNTASPLKMTINNSTKSYTFQGSGRLSGSMSLVKTGSGTATISLTNNDYTGATVISNGTVMLGNANTLSSAANLNVGPLGTLELAGFAQTVNSLSGSGVIDDNSTLTPTLTVSGGGVWNGVITNSPGSSGMYLTKIGNNTLVLGGRNTLNAGGAGNGGVQVNGGTLIITNNGAVDIGNAEFWVAQGANTATTIVDGGTLTLNNWLVVGRNNAAANGTFIVNSGTVTKGGANNIVVGSLGATGTLIVNGGQVLNNSELWLGENATANAYLYLNGGLLQATVIRPNGVTPVNYTAYFNGGTLQATGSTNNFLQVMSMVMSNGLVLDDGGFTLSISTVALLDGGGNGGFVKKGAGTVYLDTGNSYTGTTLVTNGMLAGVGSIAGPVIVAPNGNIGGGNADGLSTLTINNNLTIQGKATMRINRDGSPSSDSIAGVANISYGGVLVISNLSTTTLTTSDTFQLFSASGTISGNFTSIVGSPGPGLIYQFTPASGVLSIGSYTIVTNPPPQITCSFNGSILTLSWAGAGYQGYTLQAQTNSSTVGLTTNWVDVPGSDSVTNMNITVNPNDPTVFYRLRYTQP